MNVLSNDTFLYIYEKKNNFSKAKQYIQHTDAVTHTHAADRVNPFVWFKYAQIESVERFGCCFQLLEMILDAHDSMKLDRISNDVYQKMQLEDVQEM